MPEGDTASPDRETTVRSRGCVACGTENPISLGMQPRREDDKVVCELSVRREFRGYSNVAHGGTTCMILDELMGAVASLRAPNVVVATARIEVRYLRPVPVETPVRGEAWLVGESGADFDVASRLLDQRGRVLAEAEARFRALSPERAASFVPGRDPEPAGRP